MGISDRIETFIIELLKDEDNWVEFGRNELASIFNCVPSQINYVISTRFSPEKGYMVESRRGGGGFLKIRRVDAQPDMMRIIASIGEEIDFSGAYDILNYLYLNDMMSERDAKIILSGVSEKSLSAVKDNKNKIRAGILKNMILASTENIERKDKHV